MPALFRTVHFGYGGFTVLGFIGVLHYLQTQCKGNDILESNFDVSGTSAGSILAFLVCLGYSATEIAEVIMTFIKKKELSGLLRINFFDLDRRGGCLADLTDMWNLIDRLCRTKCGGIGLDKMTFGMLRSRCSRRLCIMATSVCKSRSVMFESATDPNMLVREAMEMSTRVPMIFTPFEYRNEMFLDGCIAENLNHLLKSCDGALLTVRVVEVFNPATLRRKAGIRNFIDFLLNNFNAVIRTSLHSQFENYDPKRCAHIHIRFDSSSKNYGTVMGLSKITSDTFFETIVEGYESAERFFKKRR